MVFIKTAVALGQVRADPAHDLICGSTQGLLAACAVGDLNMEQLSPHGLYLGTAKTF